VHYVKIKKNLSKCSWKHNYRNSTYLFNLTFLQNFIVIIYFLMTIHPNILIVCMNDDSVILSQNFDKQTCWCFTDLRDVVME
jgi:hypothetical protein